MNREERFINSLRSEIEIPQVVRAKADNAYAVIRGEKEATKGNKKTKGRWMKAAVAAAAAVCILAASTNQGVLAMIKSLSYDISKTLGIGKDLSPYATVVDKSMTNEEVTITLNEVILAHGELLVSTTETYADMAPVSSEYYAAVYINGRIMDKGNSGGSEQLDVHSIGSVMAYDIEGVDVTNEMDIELIYVKGEAPASSSDLKFSFKASGTELAADTKIITLDETFVMEDGSKMTAEQLAHNDVDTKIILKHIDQSENTYTIKFTGEDDLGNPVEFYMSSADGERSIMQLDRLISPELNEEAKSLNLTPYAAEMPKESGRFNEDYKQIGDSFVISLE